MITGHHQSDRHSQATQIWFAQKCGKTQLPCFHGRNAIVESFGVVEVCRRQSQVQTSPYLNIYLVPLGVSGLRPYLIAQLRWTEPRPNLFKLKEGSHWMNWFVPIIFTPLSLHPIYLKYPVFFSGWIYRNPPTKAWGKTVARLAEDFILLHGTQCLGSQHRRLWRRATLGQELGTNRDQHVAHQLLLWTLDGFWFRF